MAKRARNACVTDIAGLQLVLQGRYRHVDYVFFDTQQVERWSFDMEHAIRRPAVLRNPNGVQGCEQHRKLALV
jgi:hypothetical protein